AHTRNRHWQQSADLRDDRTLCRGWESGALRQLLPTRAVRAVRPLGGDEPGAAVGGEADRGMDAADGIGDGDWGARSVTGAILERVDALRNHERDYDALAERLARRGQRAETVVQAVGRFAVAVPSWALGTGGTRFGRFPGPREPPTPAEELAAVGGVHRLTGAPPRVSLHI